MCRKILCHLFIAGFTQSLYCLFKKKIRLIDPLFVYISRYRFNSCCCDKGVMRLTMKSLIVRRDLPTFSKQEDCMHATENEYYKNIFPADLFIYHIDIDSVTMK